MKILIDTNILLFVLFDEAGLSKRELELIKDEDNEIIVSAISFFEISLKYSLQKLKLKNTTPEKLPELLLKSGYSVENIDYITFASFHKLPLEKHRDPFDRLLTWESIRKDFYLLSKDKKFYEYEKFGLKLLK